MESSFSTQIHRLEKQLQDSFTNNVHSNKTTTTQDSKQNSQNPPQLQQIIKILLNSLKLNQKLHSSIVQKQAKINSQTNSFLDINAQTDSKIQNVLKRTKQLYEDTVHQNQKARFMLQQFLTPIRQEIKSKVDQTTFTLQMKMLLDEYDVMGHQISYDVTEQQKVKQQKRKSINSQTLTFLKDKILPVLSHLEQRLENVINNVSAIDKKIQGLDAKTSNLEAELNIQKEILQKIESKSLQQANSKMGDQQIDKRLKDNVRFVMKEYSAEIQESIQKISRFSKNTHSSFTNQLQTIKASLSSYNTNQNNIQKKFQQQFQKHSEQISEQANILGQKALQLSIIQEKLKNLHENTNSVITLQTKIADLEQKLEKGHFRSQNQLKGSQLQNLIKKLNDFEKESRKIKQFEKNSEERIMMMKGQIQGMRDILSKKANFSDILMHIQSKVDKREFKELQLKVLGQERDGRAEMKNNSMLLAKQSENSKSWKKRNIKSRSFFSPSPLQKPTDIQSQLQEVKRFKLGFNHQLFLSNYKLNKQLPKSPYLRKSLTANQSNTQKPDTET